MITPLYLTSSFSFLLSIFHFYAEDYDHVLLVISVTDLSVFIKLTATVRFRFKTVADNIRVTHMHGDNIAADVNSYAVSLFRCTKCTKSFPSLDLQAGHKLLDQCELVVQPFQVSTEWQCSSM